MVKMKIILFALVVSFITATNISGKGECLRDRKKFCSEIKKEDKVALRKCMESHYEKFSKNCKDAIAKKTGTQFQDSEKKQTKKARQKNAIVNSKRPQTLKKSNPWCEKMKNHPEGQWTINQKQKYHKECYCPELESHPNYSIICQ